MAQELYYKPFGALLVEAGKTYNATNIPATADIVQLQRGVRLKDENGEDTRIWGVTLTITPTGITPAVNEKDNIPFIWKEGEVLIFDPAFSYKFHNQGVVGYGAKVPI